MSWWIYLKALDGKTLMVEPFQGGGTYILYDEPPEEVKAEFNITFNYSKWFRQYLDHKEGLEWLYGKKAIDTIPRLMSAIEWLGTNQSDDYWEATSGNAGFALQTLLRIAEQQPKGIWELHG